MVSRLQSHWHHWVSEMMVAFPKGDELSPCLCPLQEELICSLVLALFLWAPKRLFLHLVGSAGLHKQRGCLHHLEASGQEDTEGQHGIQCHILAMLFVLLLKWCSKFALALCRLGSWRAPRSFSTFLGTFLRRKKPPTPLKMYSKNEGWAVNTGSAVSCSFHQA